MKFWTKWNFTLLESLFASLELLVLLAIFCLLWLFDRCQKILLCFTNCSLLWLSWIPFSSFLGEPSWLDLHLSKIFSFYESMLYKYMIIQTYQSGMIMDFTMPFSLFWHTQWLVYLWLDQLTLALPFQLRDTWVFVTETSRFTGNLGFT